MEKVHEMMENKEIADLSNFGPRRVNSLYSKQTEETYIRNTITNANLRNQSMNKKRTLINAEEAKLYNDLVEHKGVSESTPIVPDRVDFDKVISIRSNYESEAATEESKSRANDRDSLFDKILSQNDELEEDYVDPEDESPSKPSDGRA